MQTGFTVEWSVQNTTDSQVKEELGEEYIWQTSTEHIPKYISDSHNEYMITMVNLGIKLNYSVNEMQRIFISKKVEAFTKLIHIKCKYDQLMRYHIIVTH